MAKKENRNMKIVKQVMENRYTQKKTRMEMKRNNNKGY